MELSDIKSEISTGVAVISGTLPEHKDQSSYNVTIPQEQAKRNTAGEKKSAEKLNGERGHTGETISADKSRKSAKDAESDIEYPHKSRIMEILQKVQEMMERNREGIIRLFKVLLLVAYFVYFGFAVAHHVGDEGSWRLIGCTILAVWLITWNIFKGSKHYHYWEKFVSFLYMEYTTGKRSLIFRWFLYVAMTVFMVVYVILAVAFKNVENLRSLMGLFLYPFFLFLYSNNKRKVNWHTIYWGMSLQFIMALLILKTTWGSSIIQWCGDRLEEFVSNGEAGSIFMFGKAYKNHPFAMGSLVQVIVIIVGMSVITYLGVVEFIVETVGRVLAFILGTSPPEGINAVGNIFLHVPESAMLIQQYIADMTPSQLFVTYAGGLSTVGGVALVIFMSSGIPAAPLVAASAMSAPAALAAAKLAFPSTDKEQVPVPDVDVKDASRIPQFLRKATSLMDSIILGINQSVVLIVQALMFVMTFVIILEFVNRTFVWFGDRIGVEDMTVEFLFSYVFYPFAFLMGVRAEDCLFVGELLGIRTFSLAIVAYPKLGPIVVNGREFRDYVSASVNNTWEYSGKDIILHGMNKTLVGGIMDERSEIIATYALCGSASFAIMGLIIGSFAAIVPHRIGEITQHIVRALIVGTFASYLTACFAGLLFEKDVSYV